jgi:tetratricopeptide (TPR) repeat protein
MRLPSSLVLLGLLVVGCKDPELVAAESKAKTAADLTVKGRVALSVGDAEQAIALFKQASNSAPQDATIFLLLARAQKLAGNDGAAVLAIKQAEDLGARNDPAVKRERAELYRRMGHPKEAITTLLELRDAKQLTDDEMLQLAQLQAHNGDAEAGYKTLERVQALQPDNVDAKVVEAEILLISGDEVLAAKLMDRLLTENPLLVAARVLRARYFMQNGYAEVALQDLQLVPEEAAQKTEIVELKARVLNNLKRYQEAADVLQPMVEANPRDADLVAQLAETELYLGKVDLAQAKVDQALAIRPRFARALYVRGRTLEVQGDLKGAAEQYQYALKSDPSFAPALSRVWPIYEHRGEKTEAMSALERLFFMNEATIAEKVALATLYVDTGSHTERAKKLITEALRVQPDNRRAKELKSRLAKVAGGSNKGGVQIIRKKGGR